MPLVPHDVCRRTGSGSPATTRSWFACGGLSDARVAGTRWRPGTLALNRAPGRATPEGCSGHPVRRSFALLRPGDGAAEIGTRVRGHGHLARRCRRLHGGGGGQQEGGRALVERDGGDSPPSAVIVAGARTHGGDAELARDSVRHLVQGVDPPVR